MELLADFIFLMWPYILVLLVGVFLGKWLFRRVQVHQQTKRLKRGQNLEKEAFKVLEKLGYKIEDYQPKIYTEIKVDGISKSIGITPDFKVSKKGKTHFVEVKSGNASPDVFYAPTRRQMLEYATASESNTLLLLNMENQKIQEVTFLDLEKSYKSARNFWRSTAYFLSIGYTVALIWYAVQALLKLL